MHSNYINRQQKDQTQKQKRKTNEAHIEDRGVKIHENLLLL